MSTLSIIALLAGAAAPQADSLYQVSRETWVMGTRFHVEVAAPTPEAAESSAERAVRAVEEVERLLSTWQVDSEVSVLNRAEPGTPVRASPRVSAWLARAAALASQTEGAFDPAVGALIDAWDLRGDGRIPSDDQLRHALRAAGPEAVRVDPVTGTVERLNADAWIDTGAFGKGAALQAAALTLPCTEGEATLDLGGQLWTCSAVGKARRVDVAHPAHRDRPVLQLRVRDASVATSGASERFVRVGDEHLGHILDPRDGRPVPAWGSATVLHPDPLTADALATALFVMGPVAGRVWLDEHPDVAALLLIDDDGTVTAHWTDAMTPSLATSASPLPTAAFDRKDRGRENRGHARPRAPGPSHPVPLSFFIQAIFP